MHLDTKYECVAVRIIVAFDDTFIFLYCTIILCGTSIMLCSQCSFILLVYGFIQCLVESYYCVMPAVVIEARKSIYCNECMTTIELYCCSRLQESIQTHHRLTA